MFRKTWKTIKIFLILGIGLISIPHSIFPVQNSESELKNLDSYILLNEKESRLSEYKDDKEALKLKLIQLDIINASRRKFRADTCKT